MRKHRLFRLQAFLHVPGLQVQIRVRLLGLPQALLQRGLFRGERLVFFRGGDLVFRKRPFAVRKTLLDLRLCVAQRLHFLGCCAPRLKESLDGLRELRLQFITSRGKCRMLLGGKPLRLGQEMLRLPEAALDVRLFRRDRAMFRLSGAACLVQRLCDRGELPVQIIMLRGERGIFVGGMLPRLVEQILRLGKATFDIRLLRRDSRMGIRRGVPCFLQRLRDRVQMAVQLVVLREKCGVLACGGALRLGHGVREFGQAVLQSRLRRIGCVALLFEEAIRLQETHLQLLLDFGKARALFIGGADGLRPCGLHLGEPAPELFASLRQCKIFLIRGTLGLLQRGERRREASVDFIPFRGKRRVPFMRIIARLLEDDLQLGKPVLEIRAHIFLRLMIRLRGLFRLGRRALRRREPLLQILRDRTQRRLLLPGPARRVAHRLLKLRETPLELRLLLQKRGPFLIRRSRGLGKCLLARCDLPVRGGELLADLFEFRRKALLRLLVPRLQCAELLGMRDLLGGELRLDLLAAQVHLGEPAGRLRNLGDERLARMIQRTGKVLMVRPRLGELRADGSHLLTRRVALRDEGGGILLRLAFEIGERHRHALHLRLRLVTFADHVFERAVQLCEFALHLPHLHLEPLRCLALLGKCGERVLALGSHGREIGLGLLLRRSRLFLRLPRGGELAARLIDLRLQHRIGKQPLRAGREAAVLLLQFLERALGLGKLPRDVLARLERRGMLGLDLRRDLLAPRDLAVEADVDGFRLLAQSVALDDERIDLPLERRTLLAQPAGELLPFLEHRLALAAGLRLLLGLLRLERIELLGQHGNVTAFAATALDRGLKLADLGVLRLRELFE